MNRIEIPKEIDTVLARLNDAGFAAYAVGGSVRDSLMGRVPGDWDLTTSAPPDRVIALFGEAALPTGLKHGTLTIKTGIGGAEVTTFRTEGAYLDHRHPGRVDFVSSLEEDLSRRDFTVNAIALSRDGQIIDPFGGTNDIEAKILRCVGTPALRFEEDALRMLRALRFSAQLGFEIEERTLAAIFEKAPLASSLSPERIFAELNKMLKLSGAAALNIMSTTRLLEHFGVMPAERDFTPLANVPSDPLCRWTVFCRIIFGGDFEGAAFFLKRLHAGRAIRDTVTDAIVIMSTHPSAAVHWKTALSHYETQVCRCAAAAMDAFEGTKSAETLESILRSGECCRLSQLEVNGNDLTALGIKGPEVRCTLERLLLHVIENPLDNERDILLSIIGRKQD